MKNISLFLVTVLTTSISHARINVHKSLAKRHICESDHLIDGERYSQCYTTKSKKELKFGLAKQVKGSWTKNKPKWIIKPKYEELFVFGDGSVYRKKKNTDKTYERYDLKTKKTSDTSIAHMIYPVAFIDALMPKYNIGLKNKESLSQNLDGSHQIIDERTGSFGKKILQIDPHDQVPRYGKLNPILTTRFGGFVARFVEGKSKYYQVLNTEGDPISPKFPEENIEVLLNLDQNNVHNRIKYVYLFNKISDDLHWPILFSNTKYFEKPDKIKGALKEVYPYWLDLYNTTHDKRFTKADAFHRLNLLYNDGSVVVKSFDFYDSIRSDYYTNLINSDHKPLIKSDGFAKFKGLQVTYKGFPYYRDYYVFKNEKENFHYLSYHSSILYNMPTYKNLFLAKEAIDSLSSQSAQLASEGRNKEMALEKKIRDDKEEYYKGLAREKAYLKKAQAHNDALKRKEVTDAWSGVSRQLSNSAAGSKSRSECINKRAATKKAALEGKQGWYLTGGCK